MAGSARRSRRPFGACQENSGSRDFRARLPPGGEVNEPAPWARWWCRSRDRPGIAPEAARLLGVITRAAHAACARLPTLQNCRRALRPGGEANEPMLPPLRLSPPPCNRTAPWPHTGLIADLPGVGTAAVPTPPRRKIHIGVERYWGGEEGSGSSPHAPVKKAVPVDLSKMRGGAAGTGASTRGRRAAFM